MSLKVLTVINRHQLLGKTMSVQVVTRNTTEGKLVFTRQDSSHVEVEYADHGLCVSLQRVDRAFGFHSLIPTWEAKVTSGPSELRRVHCASFPTAEACWGAISTYISKNYF